VHPALDHTAQEPACGRRSPTRRTDPPVLVPATLLAPDQDFPDDLEHLPLEQVQLLHSRLTRQLEHEHLSPAGPHPVTMERHRDLSVELDYRECTGRP
jgi:hypothetical protein